MNFSYFSKGKINKLNTILRNEIKPICNSIENKGIKTSKKKKREIIKIINDFLLQNRLETINENIYKKNIHILSICKKKLKAIILMNYEIFVVDLIKLEFAWFVKYKIKTPFAIYKGTKKYLHCLNLSIDYFRVNIGDVENENNYTLEVFDKYVLIKNLGDLNNFICVDFASKYKKEDFSEPTQILYNEC